jgi:uncharacterized Zn finger protein
MRKGRMSLESADPESVWTDYSVTSHASGKTYRVALRGFKRGESYCSCADFKVNTLGTCKHISVVLRYGREVERELLGAPEPGAAEADGSSTPVTTAAALRSASANGSGPASRAG